MGESVYSNNTGSEKTENYAAKLCADYSYGGYDDWFLPSMYELKQTCDNLRKNPYGSLVSKYYWSSTEYDVSSVYLQDLTKGVYANKERHFAKVGVRAVRYF